MSDEAFNKKVIALAKTRGFEGGWYDPPAVTVLTNERVSGYSEYTITSSWEEITIVIQDAWTEPFIMTFDNQDEPYSYPEPKKSAMAKLLEALDAVES